MYLSPQEEAGDTMEALIEGLVMLKTCLSPTNLVKEMRERYPSQLIMQ